MSERSHELSGNAYAVPRQFIDCYCPSCGMFLTSTNAPNGKRIRVRCSSKGCKGRIREVIVGESKSGSE